MHCSGRTQNTVLPSTPRSQGACASVARQDPALATVTLNLFVTACFDETDGSYKEEKVKSFI